jgi:putative Mg2+ transporter-C (MgtC) family protein
MISPEEMILRLVVAAVLGGLVGLERERLEWAAGMRTHALLSLTDKLRRISGVHEVNSLLDGTAHSRN